MRETIDNWLGVGVRVGVLITLILVAIYGSVAIIEPRRWLLYLEIGLLVLSLGLKAERILDDFWHHRGEE